MILDGKKYANEVKLELKNKIDEIKKIYPEKEITLSIVLVGNNEASEIYVRNKIKTCSLVGIKASLIRVDETITEEALKEIIRKLNSDEKVNGIIVQLPLPKHLKEQTIIDEIAEEKDVDGFSTISKGKLLSGAEAFYPATPYGIIKLLKHYNIDMCGKRAVVVGRSNIVGKPMALLLLNENATVTIAHSKTNNLEDYTKEADILVVAVGKAKLITKDMVKENAVIIDVGMNRKDGVLCGDVDFEDVSQIASYITPVPGGVGPLTIVYLLENTIKAFLKQNNK